MWWLLIVFLVPTMSGRNVQELNSYATAEECNRERNRIGFEMAAVYEHEAEFRIVCRYKPKVI